MTRIVDIADGFTSASTPTTEGSVAAFLEAFANDAAYEAKYTVAKSSAYYDTTLNKMKLYDGAVWRTNESEKDNAAASDPLVTSDSDSGYAILSLWLNTSSGALFRATDVTVGAAVWQEIASDAILDAHIADTSTHGVATIAGLVEAQVFTNKTLDDELTIKEIAEPSTPASGYQAFYADSTTGTLKRKDDTGLVSDIGGGGGGGLDTLHTEDFEVANAFVTGNDADPDAAGTGTLDGTLSDDTSTEINGLQSLKYVMGSSSANDFFLNGVDIAIAEKQTNNWLGFVHYFTYNGDDDDVRFVVLDQDDAELTTSIEYIKSESTATRFTTSVYIPDATTGIRYGWQVVTGNSGKILLIDDLEISTNPFVYKQLSNDTDWASYTPTIVGLGTPSSTEFYWRRSGGTLELQGKVTSGTATAVEAQFPLPNGVAVSSLIGSISYVGTGTFATAVPYRVKMLATAGDTFLNYGIENAGSNAGLTILNGNAIFSSGVVCSFFARIPIEGWKATTEHVVTPATASANDFSARIANAGSVSITSQGGTNGAGQNAIASVTRADTGEIDVVFTTGFFTAVPSIVVSGDTNQSRWSNPNSITTSGFSIDQRNDAGLYGDDPVNLIISRQGADVRHATFLAAIPTQQVAYIYESQAANTAGGTFTAGAWTPRVLNTLKGDTGFVSLATNQFTLASGKYRIKASAPALAVLRHQASLYSITGAADVEGGEGTSMYAPGSSSVNRSEIDITITLAASAVFEIRHKGSTTKSSDGYGLAANHGLKEKYTTVEITKLS